jgi:hypothetical protein
MTRAHLVVGRFVIEAFRFNGIPRKASRTWSATPVDKNNDAICRRDSIGLLTFDQAVSWAQERSR